MQIAGWLSTHAKEHKPNEEKMNEIFGGKHMGAYKQLRELKIKHCINLL